MNNKIIMLAGLAALPGALVQAQQKGQKQQAAKKLNVLFIAVDDLRPEINCYGATYMHTPNLDRLAAQGTIFQRAYCQQALSGPTRNSLLTGLRPDAIGIYDLKTFFRTTVKDVVALPQYFKQNGYRVEGVGKIYHEVSPNRDDKISWSVPKWYPDDVLGALPPMSKGDTTRIEADRPTVKGKMVAWYATDKAEADMTDARVATVAIDRMKELKDSTFFLAVGFYKPHLPHVAPRKYWDMYDEKDIVIPARTEPKGMPEYSLNPLNALADFRDMPAEGPLNDYQTKKMIHAYRACVSFIDAQVGRLLDALDENGLADNTIIVLWGDHGYKLGEYGHWCKQSNNEFDTNAPLLFVSPGYKKGQKSNSLCEYVDVYPTLCDLAGLQKPQHLQGTSLVPVMKDPKTTVKQVAMSQYPREKDNALMGYSMRTEQYRYTRWVKFLEPGKPTVSVEIYDHSKGKRVDQNLAVLPQYKALADQLDKQLTAELAKYKNYTGKLPKKASSKGKDPEREKVDDAMTE